MLDASLQLSVGGDHDDATAVQRSDTDGDRLDDRVVTGPGCVNRQHVAMSTGRVSAPSGSFEDEDNLVVWQVGGRQLFVQAPSGAGTVAPPTVGTAAHDVRAVNDQDLHQVSVGRRRPASPRPAAEPFPGSRSGAEGQCEEGDEKDGRVEHPALEEADDCEVGECCDEEGALRR